MLLGGNRLMDSLVERRGKWRSCSRQTLGACQGFIEGVWPLPGSFSGPAPLDVDFLEGRMESKTGAPPPPTLPRPPPHNAGGHNKVSIILVLCALIPDHLYLLFSLPSLLFCHVDDLTSQNAPRSIPLQDLCICCSLGCNLFPVSTPPLADSCMSSGPNCLGKVFTAPKSRSGSFGFSLAENGVPSLWSTYLFLQLDIHNVIVWLASGFPSLLVSGGYY